MSRTAVGARVGVAAASVLGFAAVIGTGTAQAAPQDCTVTRDLVSATAQCHDTDAPAGREYTVVTECWGLHGVPNAWPLMAIGPYRGSWGGWFAPDGRGSSSCLGPASVGTLTNAYVAIYRD
ncbi:hypothetical protein [Nocardia sp. NPDC048505]|uniref:hypothetical protein n=1 Tax=unclassified Nocardia TaxID=2637762 RepID=UPI0033EB7778